MTLSDKNALVPKRRFPEFRNNSGWRTKFGCELFDQANNRTASAGLPLLAITQEHGAIPRDMIDYQVSVTAESIQTYKEVLPGDFIISLRSFQGGIEYSQYHGICSPAYVVLRKRTKLCDSFYKHLFKSNGFIQQLTRNLEGIRDGKMISYKQFSELRIPYPSLAEQQKIAECLSTLDELIQAESRKLDALKAHKRGLMQRLFPREGETVPQLRFPEFRSAPEWKQGALGVLCDLYQPATLAVSELSMTGEYLVYGANGIIGTHNEYNHEESEIAVTCRGATCGEVTVTMPKSWITGNAMVVRPKSDHLSRYFLFYYLKNHGLKSVISGSAQPQITRAGFSPLKIVFPELDEQQHIVSGLSSLDNLITAQSERLEAFRIHKRGLMQQLFPSPSAIEP